MNTIIYVLNDHNSSTYNITYHDTLFSMQKLMVTCVTFSSCYCSDLHILLLLRICVRGNPRNSEYVLSSGLVV